VLQHLAFMVVVAFLCKPSIIFLAISSDGEHYLHKSFLSVLDLLCSS
jgi:hypothetical protein